MSYPELRHYAELYFDVQEFRKAIDNKCRSGAIDPDALKPILFPHIDSKLCGCLECTEHKLSLQMRRCMRKTVPASILVWQKAEKGIGEHLLARLLGVVGDPRRAEPYFWQGSGKDNRILVAAEPYDRSVSQLWSYCGHGDPTRKRHAKMDVEDAMGLGNPTAKMLVWNLATACIKTDGHYREVYEKRREVTAERLHSSACVRCGPSGKPAQEGSPWSKAHQLADALRIVGKEILRDLWIVSGDHSQSENQEGRVA